jgi:integrase/recombinase XerD
MSRQSTCSRSRRHLGFCTWFNKLPFIKDLSVDVLRQFRAAWPHRGASANKRVEELRAFGRFCLESGWILENSARKLKPLKPQDPPREPFTEDQVNLILATCAYYPRSGGADAQRVRALVELLLETGLRLGDAVQIRRDNIVNGKLRLRTAKTGAQIWMPLSAHLVKELQLVRNTGEYHFFWSGRGKLKSCVGDWQRSLKRLFRIAGINDGCAHRFRHTFAKRYLLAGVPPDRVAILMGHTSQAITLKHYAHWVRERQEQLEADVLVVQQKFARYPLDGLEVAKQVQ